MRWASIRRRRATPSLLLLFGALCFAGATSKAGGRTTEPLGVRNAHAMAFDASRQQVLLFGGADERHICDDTFAWSGERWAPIPVLGPSPRTFPALACDTHRRRVVLFGGNSVLFGREGDSTDTFLGDTWEWDGAQWKKRDVSGPESRAEAAVAYDIARKRIVLFGGYSGKGEARQRFGDTWEWDGTRWELASRGGPAPRNGAAMAYDERRARIVLFGGSGGPLADTWEWDGRRWTEARGAPSPGRFNAAMTYDAARGVVVRFGGWDGKARAGDTWTYDGTSWKLAATTGPAPRNHAALGYDRRRGRVVLFGGHDGESVFGDTWEWDGRSWRQIAQTGPLRRVENEH